MCPKQQGTFSEKDEQLRSILAKLDAIDDESGVSGLTVGDVTVLRRQLHDGQNLIRETLDRLRQSQEESEMNARRRDEIETRFAALETEYEELIGESADFQRPINVDLCGNTEKTIHDEETSDVDLAESVADLKVQYVACAMIDANTLVEQARGPIRREAASSRE